MSELNTMLREQARAGLQAQLNTAVTNGDIETVNKITADIEKLAVQTAPKAPAYGDAEIRAELNKLDWFGTDPIKSEIAVTLGKSMDPKKFATAEAFAAALVKAVETKVAPPPAGGKTDDEETGDNADDDEETGDDKDADPPRRQKRTDGPKDGDTSNVRASTRSSGPWTKLSDAPADVQKEVKRQADKFLPSGATKEVREKYIANALSSHYQMHQRNKRR